MIGKTLDGSHSVSLPLDPRCGNSGSWREGGEAEASTRWLQCCCVGLARPLSSVTSQLPTDLKGWVRPFLTWRRSDASETCQNKVTTIITERRPWVMVFCFFIALSSFTNSSTPIPPRPLPFSLFASALSSLALGKFNSSTSDCFRLLFSFNDSNCSTTALQH